MSAPKLLWLTVLQNSTPDVEGQELALKFRTEFLIGIKEFHAALLREPADCVLISGSVPATDRADYLEVLHSVDPDIAAVVWDPDMSAGEAARLTRVGAFDCLGFRDGAREVYQALEHAVEYGRHSRAARRQRTQTQESWRDLLVGSSRPMELIAETIRLVGPRRCTVLITGESGTGKEIAARAIHLASPRSNQPMVTVNCTALPENLQEAELFGHSKGAFTGAANARVGRFEQANGSTIFLDEIGDMPLELQAKILRVLQEREIQRLGSPETIKVDVRVIAATNVDLLERVRQGRFREDLYYRLNVVPLCMPPLRQRSGDIPMLAQHFVRKVCRNEGIALKWIGPEAMEQLQRRPWAGNVRQLENLVEMAVALSGDRNSLIASDFGFTAPASAKCIAFEWPAAHEQLEAAGSFEAAVHRFERTMIESALEKVNGNKTAAADILGLKRTTLIMKLRSLENTPELRAV